MTTFETEQDLIREKKAIEKYVSTLGGSYKKLDPFDIDYRILDRDGVPVSYAEVKGRIRPMISAYPLPVSARKLVKLIDKRLNPVIIWACEDGIIYGNPEKLVGQIKYGGRMPRGGSSDDNELMVYYEKQRGLRYIRYK